MHNNENNLLLKIYPIILRMFVCTYLHFTSCHVQIKKNFAFYLPINWLPIPNIVSDFHSYNISEIGNFHCTYRNMYICM